MELETASRARDETQIFIETPYRNRQLLEAIVEACSEDTALCVASELATADERIETRIIGRWKAALPDVDRRPAVFLLYAGSDGASPPR